MTEDLSKPDENFLRHLDPKDYENAAERGLRFQSVDDEALWNEITYAKSERMSVLKQVGMAFETDIEEIRPGMTIPDLIRAANNFSFAVEMWTEGQRFTPTMKASAKLFLRNHKFLDQWKPSLMGNYSEEEWARISQPSEGSLDAMIGFRNAAETPIESMVRLNQSFNQAVSNAHAMLEATEDMRINDIEDTAEHRKAAFGNRTDAVDTSPTPQA